MIYSKLSTLHGIKKVTVDDLVKATTVIIAGWLNISGFGAVVLWVGSFISALTGIALSMMVVSIAGNRVEGLALSKLMGVSFLGLILVWFISAPYSYLFAFLPSFWIGKIIMDGATLFSVTLGLLSCFIWITFFMKKFLARMQHGSFIEYYKMITRDKREPQARKPH